MASAAVQNPVSGESKSARKKKAKAEAAGNGAAPGPAVPEVPGKENSSLDEKADDHPSEHPHIKELSKHIRNIQKKLAGMQKTDAVIAEHPGTSLDDLVAQRKINPDQRASALKKPQLQQQLQTLEDQVLQYRKFDSDYQSQMRKQKDDLTALHEKEMDKVREAMRVQGTSNASDELRKKLLTFSQFLRCAAAKRAAEEDAESDESKAFEGTLLLVYGGDDKAVDTAISLIEGSEEQVPSIEGILLPVSYSQVKQASVEHAPFQTEENWVDQVNAAANEEPTAMPTASDPTITHAGLTEIDTSAKTNGVTDDAPLESVTSPPQGDAGDSAGNAAGDKWDTSAVGAEKNLMEDSYEMVARPQDEVENPNPAAAPVLEGTSWADDQPPAYDNAASGNLAGESWDLKAAGDQGDSGWATPVVDTPTTSGWADGAGDAVSGAEIDSDGFQQIAGRHRGRGGRGRGEGDFRGRGRGPRGGFRGDGDFRGRGRGGFRGGRGDGSEFRGRGGRGRGPRGEGFTRAS